jgi:pyruvate dehydrogenase E1 component alpha subunit
MAEQTTQYHFFASDDKKNIDSLGKDKLLESFSQMLLIRQFETRAEAAYQQGKVGGFFHAYTGQEAIQTAMIAAAGKDHWYTTTYRCHALALLLGATPDEVMAELYGKKTGNAEGRGGSMHLYTDRMLGGFGIVGGHVPIATGAGFALNYLDQKDKVSFCFLGDGAVAQGAFHESLNLASLWDIPCIYVIENNQWGMGTAAKNAVCVSPMAEKMAPAYNMKGYTFDGQDFFNCYEGFTHVLQEVLSQRRPVLIEAITQRFKGHSISDPGLYRSKEEVQKIREKDPIQIMKAKLMDATFLTEDVFKEYEKKQKDIVIQSMEFAEKSPFPDPVTLEEGVLVP